MVLDPGVQVKTVEGDALVADGNFNEIRAYFSIEAIAVHPQVERRVPQTDQAWQQHRILGGFLAAHGLASSASKIVTTGLRPEIRCTETSPACSRWSSARALA